MKDVFYYLLKLEYEDEPNYELIMNKLLEIYKRVTGLSDDQIVQALQAKAEPGKVRKTGLLGKRKCKEEATNVTAPKRVRGRKSESIPIKISLEIPKEESRCDAT